MIMMDSLVRMCANVIDQMIDAEVFDQVFDHVKYDYRMNNAKNSTSNEQADYQNNYAWCNKYSSFMHPDITDLDEKDIIDVEFREVPINE